MGIIVSCFDPSPWPVPIIPHWFYERFWVRMHLSPWVRNEFLTKEEHMENAGQNDKPKVRLIKAGRDKPRSGVIAGKDKNGNAYYRCSCDRCDQIATVNFKPRAGREILCRDCNRIMPRAKPSTRVVRKGGKAVYFTECDDCLTVCKSTFLPKTDREFLCNDCKDERQYEAADAAAEAEPRLVPEEAPVDTAPVEEVSTQEAVTEEVVGEAVEVPISEDGPDTALAEEESEETVSADSDGDTEPAEKPTYDVVCCDCNTSLTLRFQPGEDESFICPNCYQAKQEKRKVAADAARAAKAPKPKPKPENENEGGASGTRIFFNIECVKCGKKETVDFVPSLGSEAVCTSCFKSRRRR